MLRIKTAENKNIEHSLLLAIIETYVSIILYQYHYSLLAGHQGVTSMYLTSKVKFYGKILFNSIRKYAQSCHTCNTGSAKEPDFKSYHTRITYDFRPMSRISPDIKLIPLSNHGFNTFCFATYEISNYVIGIPMQMLLLLLLQKPYPTE